MKTNQTKMYSNVKLLTAFIAAVIFSSSTLLADDYTKTYKEKYPVQKGALLFIDNKYGSVHCQNWEESSVSILVTVTVDASSQEKANKVLDKITVALSGTQMKVEGITTVGSISNGDFSIDYDIMMPKWINIDLENQFGELYIAEVDGSAKINLQYGEMEAAALNGTASELILKFSKGSVDYFKEGKVQVEYGNFSSEGTGPIDIYSRFSGVDVEKSEKLTLNSQYDEIEFGSVGQVVATSRFSGLEFGKITGSFEFDSEYGDIDVSYIGPGFGTGKVRNSFAGIDLTFDPKTSFNLDAEAEFGEVNYPKSGSSVSEQTIGYTTNIVKGKIGSAGTPGQVTIRAKHANVNIQIAD